MEKECF
jgi:hypothetical protein